MLRLGPRTYAYTIRAFRWASGKRCGPAQATNTVTTTSTETNNAAQTISILFCTLFFFVRVFVD